MRQSSSSADPRKGISSILSKMERDLNLLIKLLPNEVLHERIECLARGAVKLKNHFYGGHVTCDRDTKKITLSINLERHSVTYRCKFDVNIGHQILIKQHAADAYKEDGFLKAERRAESVDNRLLRDRTFLEFISLRYRS